MTIVYFVLGFTLGLVTFPAWYVISEYLSEKEEYDPYD